MYHARFDSNYWCSELVAYLAKCMSFLNKFSQIKPNRIDMTEYRILKSVEAPIEGKMYAGEN